MNEAPSGPPPDTAGSPDGEPDTSDQPAALEAVPHPETEPEPSPDPASNDAARPGRTRIGPSGTYEPL